MGMVWRGTGFSLREKLAEFKCGLGFAKTIFWGKDLAKPRLIFGGDFCPRGGRVWGGMRAGFLSDFLAAANLELPLYLQQLYTIQVLLHIDDFA